jgi:hypothetical protein
MAWKLVMALFVCVALLAFLRHRGNDDRIAIGGHPATARRLWFSGFLVRAFATLFVIGIAVRVKRWQSARGAESLRKRRLESAHTLVGAPERLGARRSAGSAGPRQSRRR